MSEARSAREEQLLIMRVKGGDTQAAEALLAPYQPLLCSLARRFFYANGQITSDELIQAGYIGLMQAARRYDGSKEARFITYAVPWALGEMKRALRQTKDMAGAYEKRREIIRQEEALERSLGRSPRLDELAAACGMNRGEIAQVMAVSTPAISMDEESDDRERGSVLEMLGAEGISVEAIDLRMAIGRLSEEERRLICLRFFRDTTQQEAARLLGRSQSHICKLERRALDHLHALLV